MVDNLLCFSVFGLDILKLETSYGCYSFYIFNISDKILPDSYTIYLFPPFSYQLLNKGTRFRHKLLNFKKTQFLDEFCSIPIHNVLIFSEERFRVTTSGGIFRSSLDHNISVYFPMGAVDFPLTVTMQVRCQEQLILLSLYIGIAIFQSKYMNVLIR